VVVHQVIEMVSRVDLAVAVMVVDLEEEVVELETNQMIQIGQ
tara:strand:+ start:194 stop:319 length:126 start_codon:yes stop_codon:yes gene_type:complete